MPRRRATAPPDSVESTSVEETFLEVSEPTPKPSPRSVKSEVGVVETKEEPQPMHQQAIVHTHREGVPDGLILGPNEPIRVEGDDMGTFVVVKQDTYRETYPLRSKRPSYVLVYTKGTQILKSRLVPLPKEK